MTTNIFNARTLLVVYLQDFFCLHWQSFVWGHQDEKKLHQLQKLEVRRSNCEAPLANPQHVSFLSHHSKLWLRRQFLFPSLPKPCRVCLLSKLIRVIHAGKCRRSSLGNPHHLMKMDWFQSSQSEEQFHGIFRTGSSQVFLIWVDCFVTIWTVLVFSWHISSTAATSLDDPGHLRCFG